VPDADFEKTLSYFGMFANDLAYEGPTTTMENYLKNSIEKNILHIIWRMDLKNDILVPTWPVVVLHRDVNFRNKIPMEVGIHYSWRYWTAFREGAEGNDSHFEAKDRV